MKWSPFVVRVVALVTVVLVLSPAIARAQPVDIQTVPPELRPWIPWVLEGIGDEACTSVLDTRQCVWLSRISVDATATGASFELDVVTERRTRVALPGSNKQWPESVEVGGEAAVVLEREGAPFTTLPRGAHTISGRFSWKKLPEVLALPGELARVALTVDGKRVDVPRRSDDGGVWLGGQSDTAAPTDETESLELHVMRRVEDAVPIRVKTRLELRVGGRPREVRLSGPLLDGGELLEMKPGELSARFETDGTLVVEVRSGNHVIELFERHGNSGDVLRLAKRPEPWPAEEVWVWAPDVALRHAEVTGGSAIDPAQTRLPQEWRSLSAFKLRAPTTFAMKTLRRGQKEAEPNKLALRRRLILDLDGDGYTIVDAFSGTMRRDWRLSFAGSEQLGSAGSGDESKLITMDGGRAGVELRSGAVRFGAVSRGTGTPSIVSAVGWQADVDRLDVELRLPPGWELVWASGADDVSPLWLVRWEIIDLLLVLALAAAAGKLCGFQWAPVAAVAFALAHHAGHAAWWAWGPLCASIFALRRVPEGRWREAARVTRWASASVLVYALVVFAAAEVRSIVYPQAVAQALKERELEAREVEQIAAWSADNKEGGTGTRARGAEGSMGSAATADPFADVAPQRAAGGNEWGADIAPPQALPSKSAPAQLEQQAQQDPKAVIQTGPGVPRWEYASYSLDWVGPVEKGHEIRLWLLAPWMRALLALFAVGMSAWVAVVLLRAKTVLEPPQSGGRPPYRAAATAAFVLVFAAALPARAQTPSTELLNDLRNRLTRAPACAPACVTVSKLTARARGDELAITAEVHAGAQSVYQLPGPASSWVPSTVEVDGQPSDALAILGGHLHLRLLAGPHTVTLRGPLRGAELTLTLGTAPHRVVADNDGWDVDGIDQDGQVSGSIRFYRALPDEPSPDQPGEQPAEPLSTPPWLEVTRMFDVGVKWTMRTSVRRVSEKGKPIVLKLPLLDGEQIMEGGAKQEGREATITLDRDATEATFVSSLEESPSLTLRAAEKQPWSEIWTLSCSEIWRCAFDGIAPITHITNNVWSPVFRPWPGESVRFDIARPPAAEGRTLTIEQAELDLTAQDRVSRAKLDIKVHSSTGGAYVLRIPTGVRVDSLAIDGKSQPVEGSGGELKVALRPGRQSLAVAWQDPGGIATLYRAPEVVLGDQVVNATVNIEIPNDRWLVYARGPGFGPDIQLWGYMLLLVAVALGLSRIPQSPLEAWQWVLLALGLSQIPVPLALAVGAWFFLVVHRERWTLAAGTHNAVQVLLVCWSIAFAFGVLGAAYAGLAERPLMMIERGGGSSMLSWYVDRTAGAMPRPWVLSTSIWAWRLLTATWSAWVALLVYRWAPKAWSSFSAGGVWRRSSAKPAPTAGATAAGGGRQDEAGVDDAPEAPSVE